MENRPIRPRRRQEQDYARKEEKQRVNLENWNAQSRYYERCQRQNEKFEHFTSPRYYEDNNALVKQVKSKREKDEQLVVRRERLNQLLMEEQRTFDIELMMKKCATKSWTESSSSHNSIPIELLQKVHNGIKDDEAAKRREDVEKAIYERWKRDSHALHDHRRQRNTNEMKMSWLDQQVEKHMMKEKEEMEKKKHVQELNEAIEERKREEDVFQAHIEAKRTQLREDLSKQMAEIVKQEEALKQLEREEEEIRTKSLQIQELESKWQDNERQRRTRNVSLENQRFHRQRLQQKADQSLQQLEEERIFLQQLADAELCDKLRDKKKQAEIKQHMCDFQERLNDIKQVEMKKKLHLQSLFDSEAAAISQEFDRSWRAEECMRMKIMQDVIQAVKQQIDEDLQVAKREQEALVSEKEEMLRSVEEQKAEMERMNNLEHEKKIQYRQSLDTQIAIKRCKERDLKKMERENHLQDLENLRVEEERLKNEIIKLQTTKSGHSFGRRRFLF